MSCYRTEPFFSVIIPTYNRAAFIGQAIASVLRQSCRDFEVIVIDDGSTDATGEALREYQNDIRYIHQHNSGVSTARNAGICVAKGQWIAFLDSDDEWLPDYLACQQDGITRFPQVKTHTTNAYTVLLDGREISTFYHNDLIERFHRDNDLVLERPLYHVIKYRLTSLQPTVMHRATLMEAGLFDPGLSIAEDYDLITRMALAGPFRLHRKELVHIHRRQESTQNLTSQLSLSGMYSFQSFAKVHRNLLNEKFLLLREKKILRRSLSADTRAIANLLLRGGESEQARHYFRMALQMNPSAKSLLKYLLSYLPASIAYDFVLKGRDIQP